MTAVNHYRDLLAGTFMARVLPPWFENLGKRQYGLHDRITALPLREIYGIRLR